MKDEFPEPRLICSICQNPIPVTWFGWAEGNNAEPVNSGRCCDDCNGLVVIPARLRQMAGRSLRKAGSRTE